ncbi:MAG: hypothetical protein ABR915_04170 [Thermoguttaceae bacterium]|jgi:hypothetical protein
MPNLIPAAAADQDAASGVLPLTTTEVASLADYNYSSHPAASIFPMMSAEEFAGLKQDISEHGLQTFIALLDGKVLDGRNRLLACKELHIQPDFCEVENCDDPIAYVLSHNLHRRNLTPSQRAQCAADVAKMRQGDNQHKKSEGTQVCVPSIDSAAKIFNVSPRSVNTAKHILDKGDKAVVDAVKLGEITVSAAATFVDAVPDRKEQRKIVKKGKKAVQKKVSASKPVKPAPAPVVIREPSDQCGPETDNAVYYIREALSREARAPLEWVRASRLGEWLSVPERCVRAFLNESPDPAEQKRRKKQVDFARHANDDTPHGLTFSGLADAGERIIATTLNAMLWLGIVEMRGDGKKIEYRLRSASASPAASASPPASPPPASPVFTCPNCGGHEADEEGDCKQCLHPAGAEVTSTKPASAISSSVGAPLSASGEVAVPEIIDVAVPVITEVANTTDSLVEKIATAKIRGEVLQVEKRGSQWFFRRTPQAGWTCAGPETAAEIEEQMQETAA